MHSCGLGTTLYIIMASDVMTLFDMFKYADGTKLLITDKTDEDICVEFNNVFSGQLTTVMIVDVNKTKKTSFDTQALSSILCPFCHN